MALPEIIGLIGVALMLGAFAGVTTGKLRSDQARFHMLNLFGSLMVIYSLFYAWNLPTFVIECAWACIAAYGLARAKLVK